jgi:putative DNA primase/helicase
VTAAAVSDALREALDALSLVDPADPSDAAERLRAVVMALNGSKPLDVQVLRTTATRIFIEREVPDARRLVDAAFAERAALNGGKPDERQGQPVAFADAEPWPDPVDGAELLTQLQQFMAPFLGLPTGADVLLPAFVLATYAVEIFSAAPYIVLHSPAPQCGKTRTLEVLALLVRRPWLTIVPSTAVLFRVLEQSAPTLLLDEAEVVRGRGDPAGDVRALLQSGYRRGAFVPRCAGDDNEVRNFRVFGPKVFALIGELPAALFDRCIPVEMQRRRRGERMVRFRPTRLEPEALVLRRMARRWVADRAAELGDADPRSLESLDERQQEVWDPLFAVGLVAGADWYEGLVTAAGGLSGGREPVSVGLTLLADLRTIFTARGVDRLASADLATALNEMEGHRWADWNRGKGITANGIARLLRDFGVTPGTVRLGDTTAKGYRREQFEATWGQYTPQATVTTSQPSQDGASLADDNRNAVTVGDPEIVADSGHCDVVTVENGGVGPGRDVDVRPGDLDRGYEPGDAWEPGEDAA